jgi:uncharacterized repeat protein (TIGR01451 family)
VSLAVNQPTAVTITVKSLGNVAVNAVNLRVTLPPAITLQVATGAAASCISTNNVVDCALGNIAAGATQQVTLRVVATAVGNSNATVRVSAANDALRNNDSTSMPFQAADGTDIALTTSGEPLNVTIGGTATATFAVENRGPVAVTDARLGVAIPAELVVTQQTVDGFTCVGVTGGLSCGPLPLAVGATARLTLSLRADAVGTATVTAELSASRPDLQPANNNAQMVYVVSNPPPAPPPPTTGTAGSGGGGGGRLTIELLGALAALLGLRQRQRVAAAK